MDSTVKLIVLFFCVVLAGCSNGPGEAAVRLGPESKDEAIRIAVEYMAMNHSELDISHRPAQRSSPAAARGSE